MMVIRLKKYLILLFTIGISPSAYAYVDPGSSLLLLQGILAAVGATLIFIRHPIETSKSLWRRFFGKQKKAKRTCVTH